MYFDWFHTLLQIGLMLCSFLTIFIGIKSRNEIMEDISFLVSMILIAWLALHPYFLPQF